MERFDKLIMWADMKEGPRAVPGTYRAVLTVGAESQEVAFEILPDPRTTSTADDYAAQFTFIIESRDLLSRTHGYGPPAFHIASNAGFIQQVDGPVR